MEKTSFKSNSMSPNFMDRKVKEHFADSEVYSYSTRKGYVHSEDHIIVNFIKNTCISSSQVLEVGGGSGYILDLISSETSIKNFYNCEVVPEAYKTQVNKDINLIGSSALNLPFRDGTFDYVIIKNLLHHLVGRTRKESKDNARRAIKELTELSTIAAISLFLSSIINIVSLPLLFFISRFLFH